MTERTTQSFGATVPQYKIQITLGEARTSLLTEDAHERDSAIQILKEIGQFVSALRVHVFESIQDWHLVRSFNDIGNREGPYPHQKTSQVYRQRNTEEAEKTGWETDYETKRDKTIGNGD